MAHEGRASKGQRHRLLCAALAFLATTLFGGLGGGWLITTVQTRADQRLQLEATRFAESLARGLADQYAVGEYGIALSEIPGSQPYLERLLRTTPGVTRIALLDRDGRTLHEALGPAGPGSGEAAAPVRAREGLLGQVQVRVSPGALSGSGPLWLFPLGLLALALTAAGIAAWGPGADLARRHEQLMRALGRQGTDPDPGLGSPMNSRASHDALEEALLAVRGEQQQLDDQRLALEALAEELLAVDFDDALAPEIAELRTQVHEALPAGERT